MQNTDLKGKNILVVGMAGTGKTYISNYLSKKGISSFDGDSVENLSGWFDQSGKKVMPKDLSPEGLDGLEWNWDETILKKLIENNNGIILFGVSSNWHKLLHLFDKVFFLYIDQDTTRKRLFSEDRENDYGQDKEQIENIIKHIDGFKRFALRYNAIELNGLKNPEEIFNTIIENL